MCRRVTIWLCGVVRLEDVRGFVFDIDGTLVHRSGPHTVEAIDGAYEVLDRIRRSGRPFAIFTNGSHKAPAGFAADLRAAGLPVEDHQVITPLCSARGMRVDGATKPRKGWAQRTRASTPVILPSRVATIGW